MKSLNFYLVLELTSCFIVYKLSHCLQAVSALMLIYDVIQDVLTTYLENLKRVLNSVVILVTFSLRIVCKTHFAKQQLVSSSSNLLVHQ